MFLCLSVTISGEEQSLTGKQYRIHGLLPVLEICLTGRLDPRRRAIHNWLIDVRYMQQDHMSI